jgi:HD-GYP domain-containing protein (c-di-GMP phosphodiesterase class II)
MDSNSAPSIYVFDEGLFKILSSLDYSCKINWLNKKNSSISGVAAIIVVGKSSPEAIKQLSNNGCLLLANDETLQPDIIISSSFTPKQWQRTLELVIRLWNGQQHLKSIESDLSSLKQQQSQLSEISIALSAEKNLDKLLSMVLEEGRRLADCEGASLFLVNEQENGSELIFKLTQNESVESNFKEKRFPLNKKSLSGFVAITGETLNINDVYKLTGEEPYAFDSSFDESAGYKTRELLTLPMRNYDDKIIGVLQFLNRKQLQPKIDGDPNSFNQELCKTLSALASQAAVAIDNSLLIENIHNLFEGFVSASVKAIESRDPVTSGHSFRVADFTIELAQSLQQSGINKYKNIEFSRDEIRELRYAALLHDFGKVGVSERVLVKPTKLDSSRLEILRFRIHWQKQKLQKDFYKKSLQLTRKVEREVLAIQLKKIEDVLEQELKKLDYFDKLINESNKPTVLDEASHHHLCDLKHYQVDSAPWEENTLISEDDFLRLSVTRGSLTEQERIEIQSHVAHTYEYLLQIPWTPDLKNIPKIAAAHHEKLDGSGYPFGLSAAEIPVQSRVMTIADIYDALTARDRPYKNSLSVEISLDILQKEAAKGLIDTDLVKVFIEAEIYKRNPSQVT